MQNQVILTQEQANSILGSVPQESNPASKSVKILGIIQTILSLIGLPLLWLSVSLFLGDIIEIVPAILVAPTVVYIVPVILIHISTTKEKTSYGLTITSIVFLCVFNLLASFGGFITYLMFTILPGIYYTDNPHNGAVVGLFSMIILLTGSIMGLVINSYEIRRCRKKKNIIVIVQSKKWLKFYDVLDPEVAPVQGQYVQTFV